MAVSLFVMYLASAVWVWEIHKALYDPSVTPAVEIIHTP